MMRSEDYEPKMWTSCEDPEECPCDFCREFRADRAFGMLRDERDQLRAQVEDAERYEHADGDGTDRLVRAIHGRKPKGRDYIGGSQANMLHEGADLIEKLSARVAELEGERAWRPIEESFCDSCGAVDTAITGRPDLGKWFCSRCGKEVEESDAVEIIRRPLLGYKRFARSYILGTKSHLWANGATHYMAFPLYVPGGPEVERG